MRIIAGKSRGTVLADVGAGDAEAHLRPTSDRVRESLFSMLSHLGVIHGARVLDLFAGTGALGLEALSRGAAQAVFVENGRVAQGLLVENIRKLRMDAEAKLLRADATRLGPCLTGPADLIFLDPPYGKMLGQQALQAARAGGWLAQGAVVVWEESAPMEAPQGFSRTDRRKYGSTHVTVLRCD
jgi:16S rRNA (guanine966-N2)-methyltransferase